MGSSHARHGDSIPAPLRRDAAPKRVARFLREPRGRAGDRMPPFSRHAIVRIGRRRQGRALRVRSAQPCPPRAAARHTPGEQEEGAAEKAYNREHCSWLKNKRHRFFF